MTGERCGNCRFYDGKRVGDRIERGHCRRYPPAFPIWVDMPDCDPPGWWDTYETGELLTEHPIVFDDEWCGEWTPDAMAEIERMGDIE